MYGLITCLIRPEKTNEPNQTKLLVGGDRVHYPFKAGTPTTDLLTIKLLINSMISTPGARFFTMDIKNFYLCTPMTRYEYMQLTLSNMPDNVINTTTCATSQHLMGTSTAKSAKACMSSHKRGSLRRNYWSETTPGLWTHEWHPISFSLIVDNFRVK